MIDEAVVKAQSTARVFYEHLSKDEPNETQMYPVWDTVTVIKSDSSLVRLLAKTI